VIEILLSLGGVVIGGVLGLGGTYLQTKKQHDIRQREEILPIASRVLAAAEETFYVAGEYGRGSKSWKPEHEQLDFILKEDLTDFVQSHQKLRIALHELSLLMRGIEEESKQLRQSVSVWNARTEEPWDRQQLYDQARETFLEHVRETLGT